MRTVYDRFRLDGTSASGRLLPNDCVGHPAAVGQLRPSACSPAVAGYDCSQGRADIARRRVRCTGTSEGDIRRIEMPAAGVRRPSVGFSARRTGEIYPLRTFAFRECGRSRLGACRRCVVRSSHAETPPRGRGLICSLLVPQCGSGLRPHWERTAQMSVDLPLVSSNVNTPPVSTVNTTWPTYSIVEGPGGTSVGKRINTL